MLDFAAVVFAGVLTVLSVTDALESWSLMLMLFLLGAANAFTLPAWQSIQPELVPRNELPAASSLNGVTVNLARASGRRSLDFSWLRADRRWSSASTPCRSCS